MVSCSESCLAIWIFLVRCGKARLPLMLDGGLRRELYYDLKSDLILGGQCGRSSMFILEGRRAPRWVRGSDVGTKASSLVPQVENSCALALRDIMALSEHYYCS